MLRFISALFMAAGLVAAQDTVLHWMPVTSAKIDVAGLPWFQENHGEFWRLPARSQDTFPKEVWNLSLDPTGGRIRFRTDSSTVALRLEWPHPPEMGNMHSFGQSGVDLYVRNTYWGTAVPDKAAAPGKVYEHVYFKGQPSVMRDITIYLALYHGTGGKLFTHAQARPMAVVYAVATLVALCASVPLWRAWGLM